MGRWPTQGAETSTTVCGRFEFARTPGHPLLDTLPAVVVVRADGGDQPTWAAAALALAVEESRSERTGKAAVVDRLAEVLLIHALRVWVKSETQEAGFLAALVNPQISAALAAVHDAPEQDWSVEGLAKVASMSRASFAARFRKLSGETAMAYVQLWRMQKAHEILSTSRNASIADVAEAVGYQFEFAFAKAFKRTFGCEPGALRRRSLNRASPS